MATNTKINGSEYYRIRRTVGYKIVDGEKKPIIKSFYGTSKGNAEDQYKEYLKAEARKEYEKKYGKDLTTFHERANFFIKNSLLVSQKYASGTKVRYESSYRVHIEGTWIDKMAVKDIVPNDVQLFYNELNVSKSTLQMIHRFMSAFYRWMIRNKYATDILSAIDMPIKKDTKKSEEIIVWDDESWDILTSRNFDFRHDLMVKMLCYSGMRIGEVLGLKYGDIRDNEIHIVRQYSMGELKKPKRNSKRVVPLHQKIERSLELHKEQHAKEMAANKYETEFIFTTDTGQLIDISNLTRSFNRFYKRHGIPQNTFHTYRRTFCTKLCEAEVPLEVASKLLGHKSLEVTAEYYALVRKPTKDNAISRLK